jgi:hypothetical protein
MTDAFTMDYGDAAFARGYAMSKRTLAFFPTIQDALVDICIWEGRPESTATFDRMAEGPLSLPTGELTIHEPENPPLILWIQPGQYSVIFCQKKTDIEDFLEIDLFLDRQ